MSRYTPLFSTITSLGRFHVPSRPYFYSEDMDSVSGFLRLTAPYKTYLDVISELFYFPFETFFLYLVDLLVFIGLF